MDTRFLQSFVVVVECGSIAEAARRLNLTPGAVSQRLKALEDDLGHALVTRVGRTVRPTAAGLSVFDRASRLFEAETSLRTAAASDTPVGQLRLGATATAMTGLLPRILARLSKEYPQIEVFIRPGSSAELYQSTMAGELDAAVLVRPNFSIPKSAAWYGLRHEPLVLIAPQDLSLDDPLTMLRQLPFIRYDRNQWGGQIVDRYLRQKGIKVRDWLELDALDAIAAVVDQGVGVSIVPDWAPPWPAGLRLQKHGLIGGEAREIGVMWNRSLPNIAVVRAFAACCEV